ncbi:Uncharacterised protein family (UPF0233) [Frankineae bacterium MT45]|nr:Uncharacterised protein family (UPF0233) [Frankineae bacterium MT45]
MPKSKVRKKVEHDRAVSATHQGPVLAPSPRWYPILIGIVLVFGLAYIVLYYLAGDKIGFMNDLGNWNLAIGFAFLVLGLGLTVRWR